ncbi:hypothetical protein [Parabacteroides sp.]
MLKTKVVEVIEYLRLTASLAYANERLSVRNKEKYDRTSRSNHYQNRGKVTKKS